MSVTSTPAVEQYIKANENLRLDSYDDKTGRLVLPGQTVIGTLSCGYGHTGPDVFPGQTVTQDVAEIWFQKDLQAAVRGAVAALGTNPWLDLDPVRRCALIDMCFELGEFGLAGFGKMLAAIRAADWTTAAYELEASKYYGEVPARAERNRLMLETGNWPVGFVA